MPPAARKLAPVAAPSPAPRRPCWRCTDRGRPAVVLAVAATPLAILVALVAGDNHHRRARGVAPHRFEHVDRAHARWCRRSRRVPVVGAPAAARRGGRRFPAGSARTRLGAPPASRRSTGDRAHRQAAASQSSGGSGAGARSRSRRRPARAARGEPRALEAGVAGDEDRRPCASTRIEAGVGSTSARFIPDLPRRRARATAPPA